MRAMSSSRPRAVKRPSPLQVGHVN
jgi:hypothetical protein